MKQVLDYADIILEAPCYLGYLWMGEKFCSTCLSTSKKRGQLFLLLSFCVWLCLEIGNRQYSVPYIFPAALNRIFFTGLILLLFEAETEKKILAAFLLMTGTTLVGNVCESSLVCLILFFHHTVKKIPEPFLSEWEAGLTDSVSLLLVILAVYWMSKRLASVFYGKTRKWYLVATIPLFVMIAVIDIVNWGASNGIMARSGGNMGLYYDQIFSHMEICVLSGLSLFAAGFFVFGMERIYLEQEKSSRCHAQIAVYQMLEEQYGQSERLRHDMKNHIIALSGLFLRKEWEKLGEYLKNMEGSVLETGGDITGNKAVDALLYQKRKQAEQGRIKWECDIQIPGVCCINAFDLCVLFGNILDNALEACGRLQVDASRFISVQARAVKKCFLLEAKNSMDHMEPYTEGVSKKENPQKHGIGLQNIGDVVRKYHGVLKIEAENGVFAISVLIPLNLE